MQLSTRSAGRNQTEGRKLYGCDIETCCDVKECPGYGESDSNKCDHGLDAFRNRITNIAISDGLFEEEVWNFGTSAENIDGFNKWLKENKDASFTFHNGAFDLKTLIVKGCSLTIDDWAHDSLLLAFNYQDKIPDNWLANYEATRQSLNKTRKGMKHREAGKHSLKTTAPYYLGVEPFWEPEAGHDDKEYVLKDTRYCLQLTETLITRLQKEYPKAYEFYFDRHLPWTKNLLLSELRGVQIDLDLVKRRWQDSSVKEGELFVKIKNTWERHFTTYLKKQEQDVIDRYKEMERVASEKGRLTEKVAANYAKNRAKALSNVEPLNLDSPSQLGWLLKSQLGLDIAGDNGKESTDAETLERLSQINPEVKLLLDYRETRKLVTSFYPSYLEKQVKGVIHPNFNSTGTRTGRLSCSNPNLQQVPGHLHDLFIARQDHSLITKDLSGIEPVVLAYYSEDEALCKLLLNGERFHSVNAAEMFEITDYDKNKYKREDWVAKTVGLAVLYGAGANRVLFTLRQAGFHQFNLIDSKRMVYRIRDKYSGVWQFKEALDNELESGTVIYNLLGRPLKIENKEDVYMKGLNTLIQSSASDIVQAASYNVRFKHGLEPLLLVHDELVTEVLTKEAEVASSIIDREMTTVKKLETKFGLIPIKVEGKVSKVWEK